MKTFPLLALLLALALAACGGPSGAEEYNHIGVQHFEEGRLNKAITAYSEAIRLNPEYTAAYYNRGQAYFAVGRPGRAIENHTRAIDLSLNDPQQPLAYAGRAMAFTLLGQNDQAQADIAKAVELGFDPSLLVALITELKNQ